MKIKNWKKVNANQWISKKKTILNIQFEGSSFMSFYRVIIKEHGDERGLFTGDGFYSIKDAKVYAVDFMKDNPDI